MVHIIKEGKMPQFLIQLLPLAALLVVMYFLLIRPQKKKEKTVTQMRNNVSVGDEIITIGGIHGKVVKVNDQVVTLEMTYGKQRINFSKWAIGSVVKKGKDSKVEEVVEEIPEITEDENK